MGEPDLKITHVRVNGRMGQIYYAAYDKRRDEHRFGVFAAPRAISRRDAAAVGRRLEGAKLSQVLSIVEDVFNLEAGDVVELQEELTQAEASRVDAAINRYLGL